MSGRTALSFILQKISQEGKYCERKPYKKPQYVFEKRISPIYI